VIAFVKNARQYRLASKSVDCERSDTGSPFSGRRAVPRGRRRRTLREKLHHQLDERPTPLGLTDTKALLDVLLPRTDVKALLYGHTHVWSFEKREGLHCVNLPAVAYPFDTTSPTGWVDAKLSDSGMALQLHCTDHAHPKHGEKHELVWRA